MTWSLLWSRIKAIPDWLIALVLTLIFLKVVDYRAVQRTRREMFERQSRERAEEQARMERAVKEVAQDGNDRTQRAVEARDSAPVGRSAEQLRHEDPELADLVFRSDRGSGEDSTR